MDVFGHGSRQPFAWILYITSLHSKTRPDGVEYEGATSANVHSCGFSRSIVSGERLADLNVSKSRGSFKSETCISVFPRAAHA